MKRVHVSFTPSEAASLGLFRCENCGKPKNNHFDWSPFPCAFPGDGPKRWKPMLIIGKLIR